MIVFLHVWIKYPTLVRKSYRFLTCWDQVSDVGSKKLAIFYISNIFEEIGDLVSEDLCIFTARSAFLELATGATGATGATEVVSKTVPRTSPPTHAGGQDDGSYTNSLKLG